MCVCHKTGYDQINDGSSILIVFTVFNIKVIVPEQSVPLYSGTTSRCSMDVA